MKIQPIVEGHGDVAAFPVLLRRLVAEARAWSIGIGRPLRVPRGKLVQQAEVERAVRLALLQPECGAVLILFDGDRDCPAQLGPTVQAWAAAHTGELPCRVVIAHREYEAWFLAATGSLRGYRGVREDAEPHPEAEVPLSAKEQMEARMHVPASYIERSTRVQHEGGRSSRGPQMGEKNGIWRCASSPSERPGFAWKSLCAGVRGPVPVGG